MQEYVGIVANTGLAIGKIKVIRRFGRQTIEKKAVNSETELQLYESAVKKTDIQLEELAVEADKTVGNQAKEVFEGYRLLLNDVSFDRNARNLIINEKVSAAYAVYSTGHKFAELFENMDDEYMNARSADIIDLSYRIIDNIKGEENFDSDTTEPEVIISESFNPADLVRLGKERIAAIVCTRGSVHSHAAIIAKMMSIPMLVSTRTDIDKIPDGVMSVVNANEGYFLVDPDKETIDRIASEAKDCLADKELMLSMRELETVTSYGRKVSLLANASSIQEMDRIIESGAEGIGLLRSELFFIGRSDFPDEDEQFEVYKSVLQKMEDRKVCIRTFDVGSDKIMKSMDLFHEDNPAIGFRGIRISLAFPDNFRTQIRAILRASVYGNAAILYPMVTTVDEVNKVISVVNDVKRELDEEGIPYGNVKEGLMIETPASVMISDELAKMVDFFCIGTNDLTQFVLAADRQNAELASYFDPGNKAVKMMIKLAVDNAHKAGIEVGICGEMGRKDSLIREFVDLGIDGFSVTPSLIPFTKKTIREM